MADIPGPGPTLLDPLIGSTLAGVARAHRVLVGRGLARLGLHPGQDFLLAQLWHTDALPQTELAHRLRVELPTVVKAVQRMQEVGFVSRRRDPHDGRVWRVQLTAAGRALRDPVEQVWQEAEEQLLRGVDPADRRALRRLLRACEANLWGLTGHALRPPPRAG